MSTNSCACSASTDKFVYSFGGGSADGNGSMKNLLGGKGANLAEMARIGLPVPPGFTITTEVCTYYYDHGCTYPAQLDAQIKEGIARMEQIGTQVRRYGSHAHAGSRTFRRPRIHARHDGHDSKPRPE